ncbi:non-ribosomal peptide synthetase [Methylicorpusculum sp.]|uniref:non-ribosomal peptide synthetase family protein n=1 Tax=Methylicorpusculum sp. TaxID=2713644 RepID=UPI002730DDC9|nr:non-ribosomal peptide synthetase [Methylicorpusculum sp.]MDP2178896.1 amino acid adenylation domain-containing protein [Methylicorpusculum sp.]MDP3530281.1 amino acid adenylation domain-containing protein [Methylicorpusculum sp.]MDZ4151268.1 amino acid adenylation domain-containing protein [Methylicorpusculum sp.]
MSNIFVSQKSNLSPAKQAVLEKYLKAKLKDRHSDEEIARRNAATAPLSFAQQRLWLLCQLEPVSAAYNFPTALRISGKIDLSAMEKAINAIIGRHAILRTRFVTVADQPQQVIVPEIKIAMVIEDISEFTDSEVDKRIKAEGLKPFVLSEYPLFRTRLLYLGQSRGEEAYVFLVNMHHIISDGWSAGVLFREFAALYIDYCNGMPPSLPELPIQYADFSYWQHNGLQEGRLNRQLAYWKKQLAGSPNLLNLPTDHPRLPMRGFLGATHYFAIAPELTDRLNRLSRLQGVTLFTVLLAAFNSLLFRYSGEKDICVGIPAAGRTKPELEDLIGFFVNTLVIRTRLDDHPCFMELVGRVQTAVLEAWENQDIPFDKLVEALQPQRNPGVNPLFQVMFVLHNVPMGTLALPGLTLESMAVDYGISKFDLVFHVTENNGLEAAFEYSTELFEAASIVSMAEQLNRLLAAIVEHPEFRLGQLSLLTTAEICRLNEWNVTSGLLPEDLCLHALFEAQALKQPERTAVICGELKLSYGELNERANGLAGYLRKQGVGPEIRVALCLDRSVEAIIGLLGILKAGAVYVPMDPAQPPERIAELLDDCNASLLLTQDRLLTGFGASSPKILCLDREWPTDEERIDGELPVLVDPSNAAYLIYTSGSTGKPKGVIISHKNAVASTFARFSYYPESPDGFLLLSPFAFDSSLAGIFWTLGSGGRLFIPAESAHQDPQALVNSVAQEALSHLLCTPSFYSLLLDYGKQGQLTGLRTAIVAGETCSPDLVAKHARHLPATRLYNEYGPTEATVWSSVYEIQVADSADDVRVPIGRPIANSRIYILDDCLNQVPAGVPGEIYVGGAGIARGYHNRFDVTAERFLPNPFSAEAGARVYRSGDKARFLPDGRIEFLGRVDHQVKIRGFRIELGEIEARLVQHNAVSDAVVLVQEDRGDKRLTAYVAGLQSGIENAALSEILREYLKATLPVYMVPSRIVVLAALPLNDNGKIDRNALSILDISGNPEKPFVEPGNPLEEELANIWMEVLGVERIGVTDDFFELGGHSILAMQLLLRIRNSLSCDLSLRDLFQMPTVAAQARLLAAHDVNGHSNADSIDWESETALDESIYLLSEYRPGAVVKSVFLTGASGFLGVFLLKELLEQSRATVYCLVRAATSSQGFEKIKQSLDAYGLWDSDYISRIYPVCGDLAQARLGMQTSQWRQLAGEIDVIYHNGASVNFVYPYAALKAANVSGTEEVLRLACTIKVKAVHYISTLSVFENDSNVDSVMEDDFPENGSGLVGGYAQSKWVAEKMVRMAGDRGLPVSIYRPSTITGDSRSGVWNTGDYLSNVIGACLLLGKVPLQESLFNTVPVDYVSRALVFLSRQSQGIGKTYHLTNPSLLSSNQLLAWAHTADLPLEKVDFNDWLEELRDFAGGSSDHPFFSLLPMLDQEEMNLPNNEDSPERVLTFDLRNVSAGLSGTGISCPPPDERLWHLYFHYLHKAYAGYSSAAV